MPNKPDSLNINGDEIVCPVETIRSLTLYPAELQAAKYLG
jgi:hypothetical protein